MKLILVTGGCGYIGSHTIVDLIENGYDVISIDNNSRSNESILLGVEKITGKKIKNYKVDLCIYDDVYAVFQENPTIQGIIHFAAYKAVGESVDKPMMYFENNISSLINILKCAQEMKVPHFVFSSSCTVYGNPDVMQVTESTPQKKAASPYGLTKQIGESIVENIVDKCNTNAVLLRYFNPVGAHPSIAIGELPLGKPQNLIPKPCTCNYTNCYWKITANDRFWCRLRYQRWQLYQGFYTRIRYSTCSHTCFKVFRIKKR